MFERPAVRRMEMTASATLRLDQTSAPPPCPNRSLLQRESNPGHCHTEKRRVFKCTARYSTVLARVEFALSRPLHQ